MVQRLESESGVGNCSVAWQGLFSPSTRIGDMLLQLKNGGEIKLPVSLQQRRPLDPEAEELELAPNSKRTKLIDMTDVSFKATTWASTTLENPPLQMLRNKLPLAVSHSFHPLDEPSPLGLTLRKSPSLLDLVSMTIAQGSSSDPLESSTPGVANRAGIPSSCPTQGKLKASNFPASTLKIGSWERISRYEGDVVAKCYYAKRKLVWEVLENGLKSKIELQWSDISAIKASYGDGQTGVLEVEVSRPPLFFKETNPQPRKHTLWEATSDFTGGEATVCKRHILRFPEGVLNKHYEKLLQCDARLKALASPGDEIDHPELKLEEQLEDKTPENADPSTRLPIPPRVKLEISTGLPGSSPSSVMESRGSDDSSDVEDAGVSQSQALVEAGDDAVDQKPPRGVLLLTDNEVLNEIAQILLGETSASSRPSPDRGLFRVSSMSGFFEENWLPASYTVSEWNSVESNHGNEGYGSDERNNDGNDNNDSSLFELDEKPFSPGAGGGSAATGSTSLHESVKQAFTRHGSSGDLLVNLPRIASLPQLFENSGVSRRDSHLSLLELL